MIKMISLSKKLVASEEMICYLNKCKQLKEERVTQLALFNKEEENLKKMLEAKKKEIARLQKELKA